jgi:hypothetical protein
MNNEILNDAAVFVKNVGVALNSVTDYSKMLGDEIIKNRHLCNKRDEYFEEEFEQLSARVDHITQTLDILVANLAKLLKVSEYEIL